MRKILWLASAVAIVALAGCGGDDDGGGSSSGGTGGGSTGGSGGATGGTGGGTAGSGGGTAGSGGGTAGSGGATGGTGGATGGTGGATGGTGGATGGTGGATGGTGGATGGTGGATGGTGGATGGTGGGSGFWAAPYNASCTPTKNSPTGHSGALGDCINCHKQGGAASGKNWLFGGAVYETGGTTPAAKVEIGVKDGTTLHYACTDSNGLFYVDAQGKTAPAWATAEIRMRSAAAEKTMNTKSIQAATCNASSCHGAMKLIRP